MGESNLISSSKTDKFTAPNIKQQKDQDRQLSSKYYITIKDSEQY